MQFCGLSLLKSVLQSHSPRLHSVFYQQRKLLFSLSENLFHCLLLHKLFFSFHLHLNQGPYGLHRKVQCEPSHFQLLFFHAFYSQFFLQFCGLLELTILGLRRHVMLCKVSRLQKSLKHHEFLSHPLLPYLVFLQVVSGQFLFQMVLCELLYQHFLLSFSSFPQFLRPKHGLLRDLYDLELVKQLQHKFWNLLF